MENKNKIRQINIRRILFFIIVLLFILFGPFLFRLICNIIFSVRYPFTCAGITGKTCPRGYLCEGTATGPDAGGVCIKTSANSFSCPSSDLINCMPNPDEFKKYQCEELYLDWAKTFCPNFKGAIY